MSPIPSPLPAAAAAVYTAAAATRARGRNPSIRNRHVYVVLLAAPPAAPLRDVRESLAFWRVGTADSRYRGPRSAYGGLLAEAEALASLALDAARGVASPDGLARLRAYGPPRRGWRSRAAAAVRP